jgi:hypothetical protein
VADDAVDPLALLEPGLAAHALDDVGRQAGTTSPSLLAASCDPVAIPATASLAAAPVRTPATRLRSSAARHPASHLGAHAQTSQWATGRASVARSGPATTASRRSLAARW